MRKKTIEEEIRACLAELWPARADLIARMPADTPLWDQIDSLSLLDLVEYLEHRFGITVSAVDFIPENFGSIKRIAGFVSRHVDAR
jgi:acyl carrier protein